MSTLIIITVLLFAFIIIVCEMYRADRTWYQYNVYARLAARGRGQNSVRDIEEGAETVARTMTE